jgi:hypothetical protein
VVKAILARVIAVEYVTEPTFYEYSSISSFMAVPVYGRRFSLLISVFRVLGSGPSRLYYLYTLAI